MRTTGSVCNAKMAHSEAVQHMSCMHVFPEAAPLLSAARPAGAAGAARAPRLTDGAHHAGGASCRAALFLRSASVMPCKCSMDAGAARVSARLCRIQIGGLGFESPPKDLSLVYTEAQRLGCRKGPLLTLLGGVVIHCTGYFALHAALVGRLQPSYWALLGIALVAGNGGHLVRDRRAGHLRAQLRGLSGAAPCCHALEVFTHQPNPVLLER